MISLENLRFIILKFQIYSLPFCLYVSNFRQHVLKTLKYVNNVILIFYVILLIYLKIFENLIFFI